MLYVVILSSSILMFLYPLSPSGVDVQHHVSKLTLVTTLTSAAWSINSVTTERWPLLAARCRAVLSACKHQQRRVHGSKLYSAVSSEVVWCKLYIHGVHTHTSHLYMPNTHFNTPSYISMYYADVLTMYVFVYHAMHHGINGFLLRC